MFMDDFVARIEGDNGAISIYYELSALIKTIKLPMAKWATSCELKGFGRQRVRRFKRRRKPWV